MIDLPVPVYHCQRLPMSSSKRTISILEKCKSMIELKQTHAHIVTLGLSQDRFILSRLLAFCSDPNKGSLDHARSLFQQIQHPTLCIYNTMIKAFMLNSIFTKPMKIYSQILQNGLYPDNYTLPYLLKACANLQDCKSGQEIHTHVVKLGFEIDIFVCNTLMVMYSAFGFLVTARKVFDEMPQRTVVSWTVMISAYSKQGDVYAARLIFDEAPVRDRGVWGAMVSGYVQNGCCKEGLRLFRMVQLENFEPDESMLVSVLSACAQLGALDLGRWVDWYLGRFGLSLSVRLGTGLVDMYAKCGCLSLARKVFDEMPQRDVVCWNAMILGLAMHGDGGGAVLLFLEMQKAGICPNDITFIAVFTGCSHSGLVEEGTRLFDSMVMVYGIEPKSEHYGCVVDLLGRAGLFEEAKEILRRMPKSSPEQEAIAWRALLGSCLNYGEIQCAELAAEHLLQLEPHSGVYVLLFNIYNAAGKDGDARKMRKMLKESGVQKTPGCSSIEVSGAVYEFIAGEKIHPQMEDIYKMLAQMGEQLVLAGYKPNSSEIGKGAITLSTP